MRDKKKLKRVGETTTCPSHAEIEEALGFLSKDIYEKAHSAIANCAVEWLEKEHDGGGITIGTAIAAALAHLLVDFFDLQERKEAGELHVFFVILSANAYNSVKPFLSQEFIERLEVCERKDREQNAGG